MVKYSNGSECSDQAEGHMVIVTGTGRSGTGTLARLLRGNHEFRVAYILEKYFQNTDPHSDPFTRFETRISAMLDLHQGIDPQNFVDSSNLYIHFIDAIQVLNPGAKFILIVRDGRDFVRSAVSRRWHERRTFGMVPLSTSPFFDRWESLSSLQRCAWIWASRNAKALEGLRGVPDCQKSIIRLEALGSPEVLDDLERFTGIAIQDRSIAMKAINANATFDFPPKEEWTAAMREEFDQIAAGMMRYLGYVELP